jgi:LysR family glycine cleavage system transcriptional activator
LKNVDFNKNYIDGVTLIHDLSMRGGSKFTTWEAWLKRSGVILVNCQQSIKINNSAAVLQACIDGQGLALARSVMAQDDLASGRLVVPFNSEPQKLELEYFIVYRAGFEKINKVRAFRDWLKFSAI